LLAATRWSGRSRTAGRPGKRRGALVSRRRPPAPGRAGDGRRARRSGGRSPARSTAKPATSLAADGVGGRTGAICGARRRTGHGPRPIAEATEERQRLELRREPLAARAARRPRRPVTRARVVGGYSAANAAFARRGSPADYD